MTYCCLCYRTSHPPLRFLEQFFCRCFLLPHLISLRPCSLLSAHTYKCEWKCNLENEIHFHTRQYESGRAIARTWKMNINCTRKTILNSCYAIHWLAWACESEPSERCTLIVLVFKAVVVTESVKPIRSAGWFVPFVVVHFFPALEHGLVPSMWLCVSKQYEYKM